MSDTRQYLFEVTLAGNFVVHGGIRPRKTSYVIASSCEEAYQKVRSQYEAANLGSPADRQLANVRTVAETSHVFEYQPNEIMRLIL